MNELLTNAINDANGIDESPAIADLNLMICIKACALRRYEESSRFQKKFKELNVSTYHFTEILRIQYDLTCKELEKRSMI